MMSMRASFKSRDLECSAGTATISSSVYHSCKSSDPTNSKPSLPMNLPTHRAATDVFATGFIAYADHGHKSFNKWQNAALAGALSFSNLLIGSGQFLTATPSFSLAPMNMKPTPVPSASPDLTPP